MPTGSYEALQKFAVEALTASGLCPAHADIGARHLVAADLAGVPSHGIGHLAAYCAALRRGMINGTPQIGTERRGAVLTVDGDRGLGFAVAEHDMAAAIDVARQQGVGIALVRNSNHFGRGAPYARQAADAGMIGLALSNAGATVAVWGGREPEIGTNPIACAVPVAGGTPLAFDMATSAMARGRLRRGAQAGAPLPPGVALQQDGTPALTAADALAGVLLPFGGHKGSAIALLVEVLAGVLPGAAVGREVRAMFMDTDQPAGTGHFLMALDVAAAMPRAKFEARMAGWLDQIRTRPAAAGVGRIRLPGDRAAVAAQTYLRDGIPIPDGVAQALGALARDLGLAPPPGLDRTDPQP